jgi:hypothetical protein
LATRTTLFVATDDDLRRLFPGWRYPSKGPLSRDALNPFTRTPMMVTSWDPRPPDMPISARPSLYEPGERDTIPPVFLPETDHEHRLEEDAPIQLRALPHAVVMGIAVDELEALADVLGVTPRPARFADCAEAEGVIGALPELALMPLARLAAHEVLPLAQSWGYELHEDEEILAAALERLRRLAREALARGGNLFTHAAV